MYRDVINNNYLKNTDFRRTMYQSSKKLAEVGSKLERLEDVQPKKTLGMNHSIWLMSSGSGFGKKQWRSVAI